MTPQWPWQQPTVTGVVAGGALCSSMLAPKSSGVSLQQQAGLLVTLLIGKPKVKTIRNSKQHNHQNKLQQTQSSQTQQHQPTQKQQQQLFQGNITSNQKLIRVTPQWPWQQPTVTGVVAGGALCSSMLAPKSSGVSLQQQAGLLVTLLIGNHNQTKIETQNRHNPHNKTPKHRNK